MQKWLATTYDTKAVGYSDGSTEQPHHDRALVRASLASC